MGDGTEKEKITHFYPRSAIFLYSFFLKFKVMAKYSKKAGEKVEEAMHEMKKGTLKTGSGKKVTSKDQAVAIGLSEAKEAGAKVPDKKSSKK